MLWYDCCCFCCCWHHFGISMRRWYASRCRQCHTMHHAICRGRCWCRWRSCYHWSHIAVIVTNITTNSIICNCYRWLLHIFTSRIVVVWHLLPTLILGDNTRRIVWWCCGATITGKGRRQQTKRALWWHKAVIGIASVTSGAYHAHDRVMPHPRVVPYDWHPITALLSHHVDICWWFKVIFFWRNNTWCKQHVRWWHCWWWNKVLLIKSIISSYWCHRCSIWSIRKVLLLHVYGNWCIHWCWRR